MRDDPMMDKQHIDDETAAALRSLSPRSFRQLFFALDGFVRAEEMVRRHWLEAGRVMAIKELRRRARVSERVARDVCAQARDRYLAGRKTS